MAWKLTDGNHLGLSFSLSLPLINNVWWERRCSYIVPLCYRAPEKGGEVRRERAVGLLG